MHTHEHFMEHTLRLALRGTGKVSPNPRVGCTIVKNNVIIGEGWHREFGGPHAEVDAIRRCTENPAGATAYVNLEPCAHTGKTPPCAPLLIEHGIQKVVLAMQDPNPLVAGKGIALLQKAGIEVINNICHDEAFWMNRFFVKNILHQSPYIVGKIAQSLDGCIALSNGESKWISCEESRREVHRMRNELDAVLIGKSTALQDNPSLTVRDVPGRNPMRIILDSQCTLPDTLHVFNDEYAGLTIYCHGEEYGNHEIVHSLRQKGVHTIGCLLNSQQNIDLPLLFRTLSLQFGIGSILVEGGSGIMSSLLQQSLLDELHVFIAPMIIGNGLHAWNGLNISSLSESFAMHHKAVMKSGADIHVLAVKS